ncbi:hypothetical protein LCGC14_1938230 [marine sediment metagenome]|uniref:Uncharacterized protein n=1 Tax=marine sediment metagenome TaxID=412755 RepID=A0A0F9FLC2_9ZZZZ
MSNLGIHFVATVVIYFLYQLLPETSTLMDVSNKVFLFIGYMGIILWFYNQE